MKWPGYIHGSDGLASSRATEAARRKEEE